MQRYRSHAGVPRIELIPAGTTIDERHGPFHASCPGLTRPIIAARPWRGWPGQARPSEKGKPFGAWYIVALTPISLTNREESHGYLPAKCVKAVIHITV